MKLTNEQRNRLVMASSGMRNGEEFALLDKDTQDLVVARIDDAVSHIKHNNPQAFLQTEKDLENRVFFDIPKNVTAYKGSVMFEVRDFVRTRK